MPFQNETLHPEAQDLTTLIFDEQSKCHEDRTYRAIEALVAGVTIEGRLMGRSEDAAADLYARLAEQPLAKAGRVGAVPLVSRSLWQNAKHYPRG